MRFIPCFGLSHPKLQTILASKLPCRERCSEIYEYVNLKDGDQLVIATSSPAAWRNYQPIVIILHGLGGSHQASYVKRIRPKLLQQGIKVVAVNFRGCGIGKGLAKGLYHAGRSEDVLAVLHYLHQKYPNSGLFLLGYSLGGNVALKLAGELKNDSRLLQGIIAITPPIDLAKSADKIAGTHNKVFRRYFMRALWDSVHYRHTHFPELGPAPAANYDYGFWEFDNIYTSRFAGYKNANEYYLINSSMHYLPHIHAPCRILFAQDDPFIDHSAIYTLTLRDNIEVHITAHGGHMGFLANPLRGFRWMDQTIITWMNQLITKAELAAKESLSEFELCSQSA